MEEVKSQVPELLRRSRTLILCPPTLIENWKAEFKKWIEPGNHILGHILDISSELSIADRLHVIQTWHENSGVLIMGYQMYCLLVENKATLDHGPRLRLGQHNQVLTQLRAGPRIVIADEAHRLKNSKSAIGAAVLKFGTSIRIALTASPLANNLQDYYAMINFVAPGYLGGEDEFRGYYQNPIEEGSYIDSSAYERRKALKRLNLLLKNIEPKV